MFLLVLLLITKSCSLILPNVGAKYKKALHFPLIGNQNIETEFLDDSKIIIKLDGFIDESGTAEYNIIDNNIDIILSDNLKRLVEKKKTEFQLLNYDNINDIVNIRLYIKPIFYKKIIALERIN